MNIALLQTQTLPLGENKLEYYIEICNQKDVKLLLLGEYILNNFFKELVTMPKEMINDQSQNHLKSLKKLSNKHKIAIVAPVIELFRGELYKSIKIVLENRILSYKQQLLIPYPHWNEKAFFSNKEPKMPSLYSFEYEGINFALMYGFEIHFDVMFKDVHAKKIDCILIPTASTFASKDRWREILKTRAFLNSCYVFRANRIGEYIENGLKWLFYGDSFCVTPQGEISQALDEKEGLLISNIQKDIVKNQRKEWGFVIGNS